MVGPQQIPFGEVALLFICQEHSFFTLFVSKSVLCRGDDFRGMPRVALYAGRHPRGLHSIKQERPALAKGPAAPAAGWRLHRGEPEPDDEDKIPPTALSPKAVWPRQDHQGQRTGVMPATTGLHQPASRSLPHERIRGKRRLIKYNCQGGTEVGQEITPKTQPRGAGSRAAGHLNCNQTPTYIRGFGPLA
jgi:hypothetical protein